MTRSLERKKRAEQNEGAWECLYLYMNREGLTEKERPKQGMKGPTASANLQCLLISVV